MHKFTTMNELQSYPMMLPMMLFAIAVLILIYACGEYEKTIHFTDEVYRESLEADLNKAIRTIETDPENNFLKSRTLNTFTNEWRRKVSAKFLNSAVNQIEEHVK